MADTMTPAALAALVKGDLDNFLTASLPGGIEAQEAAGQRALCGAAGRLPTRGTEASELRAQWEAVGFVFGGTLPGKEAIFTACTFPVGWALKPTGHSMWSDVVDDKGRKRAQVFYKAAFYDLSAHTFGLEPRYEVSGEYDQKTGDMVGYTVRDRGSDESLHVVALPLGTSYNGREQFRTAAEAWLVAAFPDHKNPLAYWN